MTTVVSLSRPGAVTVRAERTKLWTLPAVRWLVAAAVVAQVAVSAAAAASLDTPECRAGGGACVADPVKTSLAGVWVAQVAVVVLAVLVMSTEYDTPQVRVTLAAMPRRLRVLAAKAAMLAALVAGTAAAGTVGSLVAGRWILDSNEFVLAPGAPAFSLTAAPTVRAAVGTVCYLVLVAVLTLGVATLVRDAAAGVVSTLSLLFLFPLLALVVTSKAWQHRIHRYGPMDAGLAIQSTRHLGGLPISPWAGLAVLAVYAAVALVAGGLVFRTRDA
jgi:ABC-2 type transport system permease protein